MNQESAKCEVRSAGRPSHWARRIALALLLTSMAGGAAMAATMSGYFTNTVGSPDTNTFLIIPKSGPTANADGSFTTIGLPIRVRPNASGYWQTNLLVGNYLATNAFLGQGILFRAPDDLGATVYNFWTYRISGYNQFVTITLGSNTPPTFGQITNSLGFLPLTPLQVTNLIITSSNSVSTTSALLTIATNTPNFVLTVPAQTNAAFVLTNQLVATSNALVAQITSPTNGYTTLVFTNQAQVVMTNALKTLTNRFASTNFTGPLAFTNDANRVGQLSVQGTLYVSNNVIAVGGGDFGDDVTGAGNITAAGDIQGVFVRGDGSPLTGLTGMTNRLAGTNYVDIATNILTVALKLYANHTTNDLGTQLRAYTDTATNDLSGRLKTYTQSATNDTYTYFKSATNVLKTYVDSVSNHFSGIYPTNTGSAGQFISKTGLEAAWATASGGSGTGVQTNGGSGTNNFFTDATIRLAASLNAGGHDLVNVDNILVDSTSVMQVTNANNSIAGFGAQIRDMIIGGNDNQVIANNGNIVDGGILFGMTNILRSDLAGSDNSVIVGGRSNMINSINTGVEGAIILGGDNNFVSGSGSIAAGHHTVVQNIGSFGFSDWSSTSNFVVGGNEFALRVTNGLRVVGPTFISGNFNVASNQFITVTTNVIRITSAGTAIVTNGAYQLISPNLWTNYTTGCWIGTNSSGYILRTNNASGTIIYGPVSSILSVSWPAGSGSSPLPTSTLGGEINLNGYVLQGTLTPTNLLTQVTNILRNLIPTNAPVDGNVLAATGDKTKWSSTAGAFVNVSSGSSTNQSLKNPSLLNMTSGGSAVTFYATNNTVVTLSDTNHLSLASFGTAGANGVYIRIAASGAYTNNAGGGFGIGQDPDEFPYIWDLTNSSGTLLYGFEGDFPTTASGIIDVEGGTPPAGTSTFGAVTNTIVTANFDGGTILSPVTDTNIYVNALIGNDTVWLRGHPEFPMQSLTNAVLAALPGDIIVLAAGNYYCQPTPTTTQLTNGASIIGAGRGVTYIRRTGSSESVIYVQGSNSVLANFTSEAFIELGTSGRGATNVIMSNIDVFGRADGMIGNNWTSFKAYYCTFGSAFDSWNDLNFSTRAGYTNALGEFYNCSFNSIYDSSSTIVRGLSLGPSQLRLYNCTIRAINGSTINACINAPPDTVATNARVELYACALIHSSTNNQSWAVTNFTTGTSIKLYGTIVNPTNVFGSVLYMDAPWITSQGFAIATNATSSWPTAALTPGGQSLVNSNGSLYQLISSPASKTWTKTNLLGAQP